MCFFDELYDGYNSFGFTKEGIGMSGEICRIMAGGVLGAVLTCVVVIWPCKTTWAKFIVFHGVINVLMLRTGLGLKWGRELFRGWVIYI